MVISFAVGLGTSAIAQGMSAGDYKTGSEKIAKEYKSSASDCRALPGSLRDVCLVEAKGARQVSRAELSARYRPTQENRQRVTTAKSEARYAVAKEHCSGMNDVTKDACMRDARAIEILGKDSVKP